MRTLTTAFLLVAAGCASATVQFPDADLQSVPNGYAVGPSAELPENEGWERGEFSISVRRKLSSPEARRLIEVAECLYPPAEEIRAALLERWQGREHMISRADSLDRVLAGPKWWIDKFDSTLLPYALTGTAVQFYIQNIKDLAERSDDRGWSIELPDGRAWSGKPSGSFEYTAEVTILDSVPETEVSYQVTLKASFAHHCGPLCGLWFEHERRVFFDENGRLLRVEGDKRPAYMVS